MEAAPIGSDRGKTAGGRTAGKSVSTAFKVAFTAVLLFLLYRKVDFAAFRDLFANADARWIPAFFAIAFFNMYLSSLRWRLFLAADGVGIPVRKLFASHWIASFCNFFLPSNIGGDVYRVADIGLKSGSLSRSTASVFLDRLCGFIAMSFLGFAFPLAGLARVPRDYWPWLFVPMAFFAAFACILFAAVKKQGLVRKAAKRIPGRFRKKAENALEDFLRAVSAAAAARKAVAKAVALSLAFQFLVFAAIAVTGRVLRLPVPFSWYCIFAPLVCILESLPVSVNGMGLREAAYTAFFSAAFPAVGFSPPSGVGAESFARTCAGAMAMAYMALTLAYALGGGLLLFLRLYASGNRDFPKQTKRRRT